MTLSEKSKRQLKVFLEEPARNYDLSDYNHPSPYSKALAWAEDPDHGGLPPESARGFAHWINACWDDWTEDPETTVGGVLDGAVTAWCGGRVMPS